MNQITPINIGARPAHLPADPDALAINQAAFANWQSGFAVLSLRGGKWHERRGGNETTITASPTPGMAPVAVPVIPVVIVGVSTLSAKSYYATGFNENEAKAPDCFSIDGIEPDARASNKQNPVCATCRHNAWGSATNSPSGRGKACRDFKRIAVSRDLNDEPLMLQLPPTSVPNLQDYIARLARMQAAVNQVVTVMAFDTSKTAPTVTFEASAWLDTAQYARAAELGNSLSVHRMLEQEWGEGAEDSTQATALGPRPPHLTPMKQVAQQVIAEKQAQAPQPQPAPQAAPAPSPFPALKPVALAPVPRQQAPEPKPEPVSPPTPPTPPTPPPAQVVQGAPPDMQLAIDKLLNA
jgi:hypothetical protein